LKPLIINFVLPALTSKPGGGTKIMYEYANRLCLKGYDVNIFYCTKKAFRKTKSPILFKYLKAIIYLNFRQPWFSFNSQIKRKVIIDLNNKHIPDAAATIITWWELAYKLNEISDSKGKKINLIQDYEVWKGFEELVKNSYKLPLIHVVISKYLLRLVGRNANNLPKLIPNAIDTDRFYIENPILKRRNNTIIMLYSDELRKGTKYGLAAFELIKKEIKDFKVILFGILDKPKDLPNFITYYKNPKNLNDLYNEAKIFLSPSLAEGWALPPAEAMACGCAVICTDIGGHSDYSTNNETALTIKTESVEEIVNQTILLLKNDKLRIEIAENGNYNIKNFFSWEKSVKMIEELITL
jgi:glycosyltransferase involved in cell wall biosynthesis